MFVIVSRAFHKNALNTIAHSPALSATLGVAIRWSSAEMSIYRMAHICSTRSFTEMLT